MKSLFILLTAVALLCGAQRPARAERPSFAIRTASDLANLCAVRPTGAQQDGALDFCHGYAQGVVSLELDHSKRAFCIPNPSPSRSATLGEFVTWVRSTPSRLSQPAAITLIGFFKERFPCKGA